jgi:class 3 adenylate cyclase/DNA-binding SARP family transcriptional activator
MPGVRGLPTGTVTFLFTDIEGSTRLLHRLGDRYPELLDAHFRVLRHATTASGGHEVHTSGDGMFAVFEDAASALTAAVTAQLDLLDERWPDGVELRVRMGLHTGEGSIRDGTYVGLPVHEAARIGAAAKGGEILLSEAAHDAIGASFPDGVTAEDLGPQRLRDLPEPKRLFRLRHARFEMAPRAPQTTIRLLGPVEITQSGEPIDVGGGRQLALLSLLTLGIGEVQPADRLIDELWRGEPPPTAATALQVYVSNLRKSLGRELIITRKPGYVLDLSSDAVDARLFEALYAEGRQHLVDGDVAGASDRLRAALALWRGPPLADVVGYPFAEREAARLDEVRLACIEERLGAELAAGRHAELIPELEQLVAEQPLRERLWHHLMLALYRSGRQADALRAYQSVRNRLGDELGLEPGPELRALEQAVLNHDPALQLEAPNAPSPPEPEPPPPAPAPRHEPDRRPASVLTVRVRGVEALDVIDAGERDVVAAELRSLMSKAVAELDGHILRDVDSGIIAVFGAPVAHEDDAHRAVRTALALRDAVADYGEDVAQAWGVPPLAADVGIHTGIVGPDSGDTTEAVATELSLVGGIVVSAATRRLVETLFEWEAVGDVSRATGMRAGPAKVRGIEGLSAPLVGRSSELDVVNGFVDRVLAGTGGVLLLLGDAGIGKSRLLAEVRSRLDEASAADRRPRWLEGRCVSYGEHVPYWPFQELLRDWLDVTADQAELRVRVALRHQLGALVGPGAAAVYPALAAVLGLQLEPAVAASLEAAGSSLGSGAPVEAFAAVLRALATDGPVVVALDDLHWADGSSVAVAEQLCRLAQDNAVSFVLAMRPEHDHASWRLREDVHRALPRHFEEVSLAALTAEGDHALLDALIGADTLPTDVAQRMLAAADGNPFFLEELLRSLIDDGALVPEGAGWRFDHDVALRVPDTVEQVILARVDRLTGAAHAALSAASVLGRQFDVDILYRAVGPAVNVEPTLNELQHLGLLQQVRRWPALEYRFNHSLVQDAVYRSVPDVRRRELHLRAGEAIEERPGGDERAAELARHFDNAGEPERALAHHRQAANFARRIYASDAAIAHYTRCIELNRELGRPEDAQLHIGRGWVFLVRGEPLMAETDYRAALAIAHETRDAELEQQIISEFGHMFIPFGTSAPQDQAALEEALTMAEEAGDRPAIRLLAPVAIIHANRLWFDSALRLAERALVLGRAEREQTALVRPLDAMKTVLSKLGRLKQLATVLDELVPLLERTEELWYLQWAVGERSIVHMAAGDWDAAGRDVDAALGVSERIGDRNERAYFLGYRCWIHRARAEYDEAIGAGQEALAVAADLEHVWWAAWAAAMLSWALLDAGDVDEAIAVAEPGLEAGRRTGAEDYVLRPVSHLAWAYAAAGDRRRANAAVREATALLAGVRLPEGDSYLHGAHASFAVARAHILLGRPDAAVELVTPVLEAADRAGWQEPVAYANLLSGLATGDRRRVERARLVAAGAGLRGAEAEAMAALDRPTDA